jgi:hypothetical protein
MVIFIKIYQKKPGLMKEALGNLFDLTRLHRYLIYNLNL